jgi:hypothetical protein
MRGCRSQKPEVYWLEYIEDFWAECDANGLRINRRNKTANGG